MNRQWVTFWISVLLLACSAAGCRQARKVEIDIRPHEVVPQADGLYRQAVALMQASYDVDSAHKCIRLLDGALLIDSLNPDYYGMKAKLLSELGRLDSALAVQALALERGAITGDYLFQLGLFQAAKGMGEEAHASFGKARDYLRAVLESYPDSLGAFVYAEAANALYEGRDSLFMKDIREIRKRFPDRLMEIEMTRRVKPHSLVWQIRNIAIQEEYGIDFDMDSLVNETVRKSEQ